MGAHHVVKPFDLSDLSGEELSGVCFVRDYVELHFDGPILRCFSGPVVETPAGARVTFPEPGSRDVLCRLIGDQVQRAADEPDALVVDFGDAGSVTVPKRTTAVDPEIAHFVPSTPDGRPDVSHMSIWESIP
ncbi:MAG TPA: hypothetical protein VGJ86_24700 [Acidimicrobiales bacterium]|jgi:hypothetical protein